MAKSDEQLDKQDLRRLKYELNRKQGLYQSKGGDVADYAAVDDKLLKTAIAAVTATHAAIQFGYTSDGGAFAVVIYHDGERLKNYIHSTVEFNEFMEELEHDFKK